jgi:transposase
MANRYEKRRMAQNAAAVVGVDAGKRKHALCVRPRGGEDSKPFLFETTREGFERAVETITRIAAAEPTEILVGIEFAGNYGFTFAHYLRERGFQIVSVLPRYTKSWKEVVHNQGLKSDPADAVTITDLTAQGSFVGFPFLDPVYADLRYLVSLRERLNKLRTATITRLRDVLQVVWPEFETRFNNFNKKTPIALLNAFPGPDAFLAATKKRAAARDRRGQPESPRRRAL